MNINDSKYLDIIEDIMKNDSMRFIYERALDFNDTLKNALKDTILQNNESIHLLFELFRDRTLLNETKHLLLQFTNDKYLTKQLPGFINKIINLNSAYKEQLSKLFLDLAIKLNSDERLAINTTQALMNKVKEILNENGNFSKLHISQDCKSLFNLTFFDLTTKPSNKKLFDFFIEKFFVDSSINKGDLLTYDNCLLTDDKFKHADGYSYIIYPSFVIAFVNNPVRSRNNKNTSFFLKTNYIISICFPFGFANETEQEKNRPMCSEKDYNNIINFLFDIFEDLDNVTINSFYLYENNIKPGFSDKLYGIIGFIILLIPLIIIIFLAISKKIIESKQSKKEAINELIEEEEDKKKVKYPKWYFYLNDFFDIFKNGKELFNFSLDNTNYNNVNGLTYIKGVIGFSIILTAFGQTFIALVNLPMREYGIWDYYSIMNNLLYIIIFIGYKYSPRILFSCSGYSLIYKYLCYIGQEGGLYFLKFLFLQSYKYILLFSVLVIFRHSLYYIIILLRNERRPDWAIFKYYLDKEKIFENFFSFLFNIFKDNSELKVNLISNFYIPINEIFFFLFGLILISFGYRFKLRIDIVIISLIILIFATKILLYIFYWHKKYNFLTTNDYYVFDYGLVSINPLYNLSCFLIGMFFGLSNYTIQKGITDLYGNDNNYNKIFLLRTSGTGEDGDEFDEQNKNKNPLEPPEGNNSISKNLIINDDKSIDSE